MKNVKIYSIFGLLAGILLLYSFASNPLNGRTGPPCDINFCADCHQGGSALDGILDVIGLPDTVYTNTEYQLEIILENPNLMAARAGFQMTAVGLDNLGIGVFSSLDSNATVQAQGSRQYLEHNPAKHFPGTTDNVVRYTASWTAPADPVTEIINFCIAGNFANGNGNSSGDRIVQMSFTTSLEEAVSTATDNNWPEPSFRTYPNPVINWLQIESPDKQALPEMLHIWDQSGRIVRIIEISPHQRQITIDMSYLAKGIYFIKLGDEHTYFIQKLLKI